MQLISCTAEVFVTSDACYGPVLVAQSVKQLLIGHSVFRPDELRALADLGSNPGLEEGFSVQLG